jgi:hypothetical protein
VALWWAGDVVLVIVLLVVIMLLQRVMKPIKEIQKVAGDIIEHAGGLSNNLQAVPKLLQTQRLVGVARQGVGAYGAAIEKLL